MTTLLAFFLVLVIIVLLHRIVRDGLTDQVELFSFRNLFLLGFIVFQLTSAATSLLTNEWGELWPQYPATTGTIYSFMIVVFLALFFLAYGRGWGVTRVGQRPSPDMACSPVALIGIALLLVVIGAILRLLVTQIPLLGVLAGQMAPGVLAVACGLAAWAWAPRLTNPFFALAAAVIVLAVVPVLLYQSFTRRELLGAMLGFGWGLYYGHWRLIGAGRALRRAAIVGTVAIVFMGIFSAARSGQERDRTVGETISAMMSVGVDDIKIATIGLFGGQYAASFSMWSIEVYPRQIEYDTLHTLRYFLTLPIPRDWWEDKPEALGRVMVRIGPISQVGSNYSVGPGLIGHANTDNPWIALPLYAIGLGLLMRYLDERIRWNLNNPFIVLPLGAALSQFIGLARGETGLFLFNATMGMFGGWVALTFCGSILVALGIVSKFPRSTLDDYEDDVYSDPLSMPHA